MRDGELRKLSPYFVPKILANAAAGRISMDFKLRGPNLAAATGVRDVGALHRGRVSRASAR